MNFLIRPKRFWKLESIVHFLGEQWEFNTVQCCKIPGKNAECFAYSLRNSEQDLRFKFVFQYSECAMESVNLVPLRGAQNPLEDTSWGSLH